MGQLDPVNDKKLAASLTAPWRPRSFTCRHMLLNRMLLPHLGLSARSEGDGKWDSFDSFLQWLR
jgi:hypothetical protein